MWKSVRDYAKDTNTSTMSVYKKIKSGSLKSKIIDGIKYVTDKSIVDSVQGAENSSAYLDKIKLENQLKLQRLKNLQQDTLLKKQKQTTVKELYRQQYCQGVFECFTEAFANLKNLLIQLKLNKQQNSKIQDIFSRCLDDFAERLKKYLSEKDKQEMQSNENEVEIE